MWVAIRNRRLTGQFTTWLASFPRQLRSLTEEEKIRIVEAKKAIMWKKQVGNLIRKLELLSLIREYIEVQERYVTSRLLSNARLLAHATKIFEIIHKPSP